MDNIIQEYIIGENQQKNYSFLLDATTTAHDVHIRFYVERNAVLKVEMLIVHTNVNVIINCILRGEGADAHIMGAYIVDAAHKVHINTMQHHTVEHTRSTLMMKGVLRDSAHAHYHGTIRVEKEAQGTYASQENKNIVLSNNARAVSVPSLEVLTHDVHCFHGSAIGRFDEEQLFYAESRGIDEKTAQRLLLNAFFADIFVDEMMKEKVRAYCDG
ncbi:MAG TPA: SufD family Fe-S cluster assembly protein [Candidatus Babeliales bacterium]|nr:SufD family Fe-S cluster assembly protein [Candidatus Babeliales bacterium]